MIKSTHFSRECDYCGKPMKVQRHPHGGRTRKLYCSRSCSDKMARLRKAEKERELLSA